MKKLIITSCASAILLANFDVLGMKSATALLSPVPSQQEKKTTVVPRPNFLQLSEVPNTRGIEEPLQYRLTVTGKSTFSQQKEVIYTAQRSLESAMLIISPNIHLDKNRSMNSDPNNPLYILERGYFNPDMGGEFLPEILPNAIQIPYNFRAYEFHGEFFGFKNLFTLKKQLDIALFLFDLNDTLNQDFYYFKCYYENLVRGISNPSDIRQYIPPHREGTPNELNPSNISPYIRTHTKNIIDASTTELERIGKAIHFKIVIPKENLNIPSKDISNIPLKFTSLTPNEENSVVTIELTDSTEDSTALSSLIPYTPPLIADILNSKSLQISLPSKMIPEFLDNLYEIPFYMAFRNDMINAFLRGRKRNIRAFQELRKRSEDELKKSPETPGFRTIFDSCTKILKSFSKQFGETTINYLTQPIPKADEDYLDLFVRLISSFESPFASPISAEELSIFPKVATTFGDSNDLVFSPEGYVAPSCQIHSHLPSLSETSQGPSIHPTPEGASPLFIHPALRNPQLLEQILPLISKGNASNAAHSFPTHGSTPSSSRASQGLSSPHKAEKETFTPPSPKPIQAKPVPSTLPPSSTTSHSEDSSKSFPEENQKLIQSLQDSPKSEKAESSSTSKKKRKKNKKGKKPSEITSDSSQTQTKPIPASSSQSTPPTQDPQEKETPQKAEKEEKALTEIDELRKQVSDLQNLLEETQRRNTELNGSLENQQKQISTFKTSDAKQKSTISQLTEQLRTSEQNLKRLQSAHDRSERTLKSTKDDLKRLQSAHEQSEQTLKSTEDDLKRLQGTHSRFEKKVKTEKEQHEAALREKERELERALSDVKKFKELLTKTESTNSQLRNQLSSSTQRSKETLEENKKLNQVIAQQESKLQQHEAALQEKERELERALSDVKKFRESLTKIESINSQLKDQASSSIQRSKETLEENEKLNQVIAQQEFKLQQISEENEKLKIEYEQIQQEIQEFGKDNDVTKPPVPSVSPGQSIRILETPPYLQKLKKDLEAKDHRIETSERTIQTLEDEHTKLKQDIEANTQEQNKQRQTLEEKIHSLEAEKEALKKNFDQAKEQAGYWERRAFNDEGKMQKEGIGIPSSDYPPSSNVWNNQIPELSSFTEDQEGEQIFAGKDFESDDSDYSSESDESDSRTSGSSNLSKSSRSSRRNMTKAPASISSAPSSTSTTLPPPPPSATSSSSISSTLSAALSTLPPPPPSATKSAPSLQQSQLLQLLGAFALKGVQEALQKLPKQTSSNASPSTSSASSSSPKAPLSSANTPTRKDPTFTSPLPRTSSTMSGSSTYAYPPYRPSNTYPQTGFAQNSGYAYAQPNMPLSGSYQYQPQYGSSIYMPGTESSFNPYQLPSGYSRYPQVSSAQNSGFTDPSLSQPNMMTQPPIQQITPAMQQTSTQQTLLPVQPKESHPKFAVTNIQSSGTTTSITSTATDAQSASTSSNPPKATPSSEIERLFQDVVTKPSSQSVASPSSSSGTTSSLNPHAAPFTLVTSRTGTVKQPSTDQASSSSESKTQSFVYTPFTLVTSKTGTVKQPSTDQASSSSKSKTQSFVYTSKPKNKKAPEDYPDDDD